MSEPIARIAILEQRSLQLDNLLSRLLDRIDRLEAMVSQVRAGAGGGSGSATAGYYIDPVVISAGGNVTGKTVKYLVGGTGTTITTNGTIYNVMDVATVSTANKKIIVVPNGDGTYLAVAQSC